MKFLTTLALLLVLAMPSASAVQGLLSVKSEHSVDETVVKLKTLLKAKGMSVFNHIDHQAGAEQAGNQLRDTTVLIFGNPKVGSPLMQCQQSIAIDLPQKMLVWQDAQGRVWLGYNDPLYLGQRHGIDMNSPCYAVLEKVSIALANFAAAAAQ